MTEENKSIKKRNNFGRKFAICKRYIAANGDTNIYLPQRQTLYSAGYDFYCPEEVIIPSIWKQVVKSLFKFKLPIKPTIVFTHVKAYMRPNEFLLLANRSSNPWRLGLVCANGVGIIDRDFADNPDNDGDIGFSFYNFMPWDVVLHPGDRIGQGIFQTYLKTEDDSPLIKNRTGGFGSTNK